MKFKGTKLSKRTVALLAAAIMLFSTGGIMGVLAEPALTSQDYDATIATNSIEVQLTDARYFGTASNNLVLQGNFNHSEYFRGKILDIELVQEE